MLVLAVDDSPTILEMICATLGEDGHEVLRARDGHEAMNLLKGQNVDLVVSDINMAAMDGFELAGQVRKDPLHHGMPIVFMADFKQRCRAAGGTGWISKPFQPGQLIDLVRRFDT